MNSFEQDVAEMLRWFASPRFAGIKAPVFGARGSPYLEPSPSFPLVISGVIAETACKNEPETIEVKTVSEDEG